MITGRLSRYFGWKFLGAVAAVFGGALVLIAMVDFIEMLRRTSDKEVSALFVARITFYRVPFITERVMPFAILIGAMSCYLNLSRRLELVVARAAGISAWQFIAPVLALAMVLGVMATTLYNPVSAALREQSVRLEAEVFGGADSYQDFGSGFWVRQRSEDGQAIINSKASRQQGSLLSAVSIFRYDLSGHFRDRIEAKSALLRPGFWHLEEARIYANGVPPADFRTYDVRTNLTPAQVRESFATPETVPFWQLSSYIQLAESAGLAAAAYRLQYYQLLVLPFYLGSMVLLAAAVSLRFFRFGGVQKMVLSGIGGGFLLYVLAKITGDLSKAGLMPAVVAASFPAMAAGLTGVITLLYQEDG